MRPMLRVILAAVSKAIHTPGKIEAMDPVNVILYHHAQYALMQTTMPRAGYEHACGSDKDLWVFDAMHGGLDWWQRQQENWAHSDRVCVDGRYHTRQYSSQVGDFHDNFDVPKPSFEFYTVMPTHYEPFLHQVGVNPQRGQDELARHLAGVPEIGNIRHVNVGAGGCYNCPNWNGIIDFYERTLTHSGAPAQHDPCGTTADDRHSIWTTNGFTKIKFWCWT